MHFNPRSREGSDGNNDAEQHTVVQEFQSTLPRRERRAAEGNGAVRGDFNPRSREGSDDRTGMELRLRSRFQSTLPRRERRGAHFTVRRDWDFNPRSREGSDGFTLWHDKNNVDFNPRSREGSDHQNDEVLL